MTCKPRGTIGFGRLVYAVNPLALLTENRGAANAQQAIGAYVSEDL
jgi:hypothetical protein